MTRHCRSILAPLSAALVAAAALTASARAAAHDNVAELGGRIVQPAPFGPPPPATILIHEDAACVAGTRTDAEGRFSVGVAPGTYWVQVLVGGTEVANRRASVPAGSSNHEIWLESPVYTTPPIAVASG